MLSVLRKKAQSPFIQATVVIIALVFIFWGVGTSRQGGRNVVVTVNDEDITLQEFQQAYEQRLSQFRDQFGGSLPKGLLESLDIKSQVLNQLIQGVLLRQAAKEMGILASTTEVKETIQEMEAFRSNGTFDIGQYTAILSASRTTPEIFESSMRSDLLSKKLIAHLDRFTKVTTSEIKDRFDYENEEIKLEYVVFSSDGFKEKVEISDDRLLSSYQQHKEKYKTDIQIKLKYLSFPIADEVEQIEISDDEIQNYYEENIARFTTPEQRSARHILFKTEEGDSEEVLSEKRKQAEDVLEMVTSGDDFAKLAQQFSEGPSAPQGGNLGLFAKGQMVKAFEDAVFSLEENEISNIVKTRFGFHIIKLDKIVPASKRLLEDAKEEVVSNIKNVRSQTKVSAKAAKAYEDIILAGNLEKYAEASEIDVLETDFFSRQSPPNALENSGTNIVADQTFLSAAFSLKKGELSSLVDLGWAFAIIYAKDIKDREVLPFEEVQEQVRDDFVAEQAETLAKKAAEELLAAVKNTSQKENDQWKTEIEKAGAIIKESDFFSRNGSDASESQKLPASILEKGFRLSAVDPYPEKIEPEGTSFYVFKLKEKKEPQAELFEEKQEEITASLFEQKKQELLTAWIENLKSKAEIIVDEKLL